MYDYDSDYSERKRITLEEFESDWKPFGVILVRGIRVCEDNPNENGMGCVAGEEREDGESCGIDEFEVIETDKKYE